MPTTVRELLGTAKQRLLAGELPIPRREANLLLAHVLECSEVRLLAHDELAVDDQQAAAFDSLIARRLRGEPVAYLTGRREFFGRSFMSDARVLVPRPETEHLIAAVLALDLPSHPRILDLGTGSGCIAVTLALEIPGARVVAGDRSLGALVVAGRNANTLTASLTRFCGHWLEALDPRSLDLIVSNPPYIATADADSLSPEITAFEPHLALFAGEDGLEAYRGLYASLHLVRPGTPVVSEIGRGQEGAVVSIAASHGFLHQNTIEDYAAIPRVVVVNRQ